MPLDPAKIRARRESLKLTQREAAALAKMPQPNWLRIESGVRTDPTLSTAERIASALRTTIENLVV